MPNSKLRMKGIRIFAFLITMVIALFSQAQKHHVNVVGVMSKVMRNGMLEGVINLDTIGNKNHLYGIGPIEYLKGEIIVIDGKSFISTVLNDTLINVEESFKVKAPFFGYVNESDWQVQNLPDNILNIRDLEQYLTRKSKTINNPFIFRLFGLVDTAMIHVLNLPKGAKIKSPEDSHHGQLNMNIVNEEAEIIGFFSRCHKGIFTHHDTYLHLHLITANKSKMGHLDDAQFSKGKMKLFLPR